MKIKKLNIESYRHLENINLDFTYPEGHPKAGMPLDKICLIGQSATGKTSLLELIKNLIFQLSQTEVANGGLWSLDTLTYNGNAEFSLMEGPLLIRNDSSIRFGEKEFHRDKLSGGAVGRLIQEDIKLIYFSSDIISEKTIQIFNQNPLNIINALSEGLDVDITKRYIGSRYIYEFTQDVDERIWFSLLGRILEYRRKFLQMATELIKKGKIADLNKVNAEIQKWSAVNKNPLVPFSELFNPILEKLNLEIDPDNTDFAIPIKSKVQDDIIPISSLSTGTKGLLLSFFPLFEFDTSDSIILIDEPERSLFPDLQVDLFSYYRSFAPDAQFITATHSPFIAAAFEPEERFILYYEKNGKIAVRRGESPIGDDPNDILRNDFQVDFYNDYGKRAYQQYLDLKRKMQEETEPQRKRELLSELTQLGDKYNF
ncbi:AAA ATPase domain-containing protein [Chitinophaga sp. YR627]|uniref:ATP-binding protein n=1 Tax=Chitinophaga sp. YR627 TaxID=1881041 RepID=UPI0008ECA55B|nr:ATP-binding protein [Chitinophaga sp. YR627]SFN74790.1 AAA ATPase domain-containing protein [Chitinophaga sp. YR627]